MLAGFLREQAEWRLWKAEERPGEARDVQSAEQLLDLAELVEVLPVEMGTQGAGHGPAASSGD